MSKIEYYDRDNHDCDVTIDYTDGLVRVSCWFDGGFRGWISDEAEDGLPLAEFLDRLGITDEEIRKARSKK